MAESNGGSKNHGPADSEALEDPLAYYRRLVEEQDMERGVMEKKAKEDCDELNLKVADLQERIRLLETRNTELEGEVRRLRCEQ